VGNESSRRQWLKATGLGISAWLGGGLLGGCASGASARAQRKLHGGESIRIAHITDVHCQPERGAQDGMAQCLQHLQSQNHRPQLILNTGDSIFDSLYQDRARTELQWKLWTSTLRNECSTPIAHCLGNHDIWGWVKHRSETKGTEPGWGKQLALDMLGRDKPYHAFDRGGWRFIMLDSCQPFEGEEVWYARLDDEQFAWLENELKNTTHPVLVATHVPIMSPAVLLDTGRIGGTPEAPAFAVRRSHTDVKRIGKLFSQHPNVKLCISGHLHQIDRAEYRGVTYMSNPAVSGGWWKGKHLDAFGPMYTMYDLNADGTFVVQYADYGWETREEEPAAA
jgi:3',5'-cyclic-AMP phosphodiesterase